VKNLKKGRREAPFDLRPGYFPAIASLLL